MNVFFYLSDLPDEFTDNFEPDQCVRFSQIIVLARKAHYLLQEKQARIRNESRHYTVDESLLEDGLNELDDKEYQALLQ